MKAHYARGHPYISGETVTPGRFECVACGTTVEIEVVQNLPVCPSCFGDRWEEDKGARGRIARAAAWLMPSRR